MHGPMHGKGLSLFQAKKNLHPTGDEYAHDHALAERGFSYDKGIVYVLMERREAFYTLPFTLWPPESSFLFDTATKKKKKKRSGWCARRATHDNGQSYW